MKELHLEWCDELALGLTTLAWDDWVAQRQGDEIDYYYETERERRYLECLS